MKLILYSTGRFKEHPDTYHAQLGDKHYIISIEAYLKLNVLKSINDKLEEIIIKEEKQNDLSI